jgi:hypothetical protein
MHYAVAVHMYVHVYMCVFWFVKSKKACSLHPSRPASINTFKHEFDLDNIQNFSSHILFRH